MGFNASRSPRGYLCKFGTPRQIQALTNRFSKWFNAATVVYAPTILAAKLAILYIYRRVFVPRRWGIFDWTLRIFMAILILFYLATFLVKIWECNPRERIWDRSIPGKCVNVSSLLNTSGLFNTLTDIIILLIPVKSVWNLNMTTKRKVGVVAAFTVGFTYVLVRKSTFMFNTSKYVMVS